jgi:hypothetical protein
VPLMVRYRPLGVVGQSTAVAVRKRSMQEVSTPTKPAPMKQCHVLAVSVGQPATLVRVGAARPRETRIKEAERTKEKGSPAYFCKCTRSRPWFVPRW